MIMNIVFCSDDKYAPYLKITLYSILRVHNNSNICFYIIDSGISESHKQEIQYLVNHYHCNITFIPIDIQEFNDFPLHFNYISLASYARLKLADYLPNLDKVLYLDIDLLVMHDLSELWQVNLKDNLVGACFDHGIEYIDKISKKRLGLTEQDTYFNAGVLLINLQQWRKIDLFTQAKQLIANSDKVFLYQDQDILNILCKNKVLFMNNRFNIMPKTLEQLNYRKKHNYLLPRNRFDYISEPFAIFHFCGEIKYWDKDANMDIYKLLCNELEQIMES